MAFPQVQSINTSSEAVNVTTHTVSLPATVATDDWLLIIASVNGTPTLTDPSGWTKLIEIAATNNRPVAWKKKADGTEGGTTVTFTTSAAEQSSHISFAGDGWSEDLNDIEVSTGATGSSSNPDPDTVTPSWGSDDNLFLACYGLRRGRTATAFPTNYNDNQTQIATSTSTSGSGAAVATRELAAASDNPGTYTLDASTPWGAYTIAIRPTGVAPAGRIMSSLAGSGGLAGMGGIAGQGGGLAG